MYGEFELKRWNCWQKQTLVKTQECTLTTKLKDDVIFETEWEDYNKLCFDIIWGKFLN
jgi:hypothetical protein